MLRLWITKKARMRKTESVRIFILSDDGRMRVMSQDPKDFGCSLSATIPFGVEPATVAENLLAREDCDPKELFFLFHNGREAVYAGHGEPRSGQLWISQRELSQIRKNPSVNVNKGFARALIKYERMKGLHPSREQCLDILQQNHISAEVIAHSKQVCRVALKVAGALQRKKKMRVNRRLLEASALLHDIMKMHAHDHEIAGALVLRRCGFPLIAEAVKTHGLHGFKKHPPVTWEQKIILYSDKRVDWDQIVSVEKRFEELAKRYPKTRASERKAEYEFVKKIEMELGMNNG